MIAVQSVRGRAILRRLGSWPIRPVRRTILLAVAGVAVGAVPPILTAFLARRTR